MKTYKFKIEVVGIGVDVEDAWVNVANELKTIAHAIEWDDLRIPAEYEELDKEE